MTRRATTFRSLLLASRRWWIVPILIGAIWLRWDAWGRSVNEDESYFSIEPSILFQNPAAQATRATAAAYFTSYRMFDLAGVLRATGYIEIVRLPFLIVGLLGIWFGWRLGKSTGGWLAGFVAAMVLTLWPFKAYSDVEVRYYCLMLSLPVGQLWLLEQWRLQPTWPRFVAAIAMTGMACLIQVLCLVLLIAPWLYAVWVSIETRKRTKRLGGSIKAFQIQFGLQVVALAIASLVIVYCNRGPAWFSERLGLNIEIQEDPEVTRAREQGLLIGSKVERGRPAVPSPLKAVAWSAAAIGQAFVNRDAARLFGLQETPRFFWNLFTGMGGRGDFVAGDWANILFLVLIAAGSIALVRRSPPLLLSLWAVAIANAMLIDVNRHLYMVAMRYYALGGLMLVILASFGIVALIRITLFSIRQYGDWRSQLAAAFVLGIVSFIGLQNTVRGRAEYFIQDWKSLHRTATARFPLGAFYLGMAAPTQQLYNDLAAARFSPDDMAEYWNSPRRNRFDEAYLHPGWTDMALLEQLNPFSGLVVFNPYYYKPDYFPFYRYKNFVPVEPVKFFGVNGAFIPLGRMAFVARGHATLPIAPRFSMPNTSIYRLDCHYEVPGAYELTIGGSDAARLNSVTIDGRAVPFETIQRHEPWEQFGVLEKIWENPREIHVNPICRSPKNLYRARFNSPVYFNTTQTLELAWSDRLTTSAPVVQFKFAETDWNSATKSVSAGELRAWRDNTAFNFNVPLRIERPEKPILDATLYLDDSQSVVAQRPNHLIMSLRPLNAGDVVCGDPLRVSVGEARKLMNKPLRLVLALSEADNTPGKINLMPERIMNEQRQIGTGRFLVSHVQFVERNGTVELMMGR